MLPDAVHVDPGGEGMIGPRDPLGELETSALALFLDDFFAGHDAGTEETARDAVAEFGRLAFQIDAGVLRGGPVARSHGERRADGPFRLRDRPRFARVRLDRHDGLDESGRRRHHRRGLEDMQVGRRSGESLVRGHAPHRLGALENAGEGVVVACRDGIVFVIVAAGAGDADPQQPRSDHGDLVVDDVHVEVFVHRLGGLRPEGEEAGRDELAVALAVVLRRHLVARDLLPDKDIKRPVLVEGGDDVIAIAPSVGEGGVAAEPVVAVRLAVAGHVEPMASPAFAEAWRSEELVNENGDGRVSAPFEIGEEGLNPVVRGSQPGQVEAQTAHEPFRRGVTRGFQAGFFDVCQDEPVDVRLRPGRVLHRGNGRVPHGLEGPVRRLRLDGRSHGHGRTAARIGRAHRDPLFEVGDDGGRQGLLRRHLEIVLPFQRVDEK